MRMCEPSTSASVIRTILWYRSLSRSNSSPMPAPIAVMSAWISSFLSMRSRRARSTLRIFPRIGRMAWNSRVAGALGRPAGAVALDDEELAERGVLRRAVGELARHRRRLEQRLAPGEVAGLAGGHAGLGRLVGLGRPPGAPRSGAPRASRRASRWWPSRPATASRCCRAWPWSGPRTAGCAASPTRSR